MWAKILLIFVLSVIVYEDFRQRAISVWTIPAVFFLAIYLALSDGNWQFLFLILNIGFVLIQLIGLSLYFSIKHKQFVNITKNYLGIGDILFFIAITPLFSPFQFCFFFVVSLVVAMLLFGFYQIVFKKETTVPLAGLMGVCLLFYLGVLGFYGVSFYNDWVLIQFIYG